MTTTTFSVAVCETIETTNNIYQKSASVEKHIFRGYIVSIEDVSRASTTEDMIHNIQWESNSWQEVYQKMGDMFWERNDGLMKAPPLPIHSTNQLTSHTVLQAHHLIKPIIKNFTTKKTIIHLYWLITCAKWITMQSISWVLPKAISDVKPTWCSWIFDQAD
jgi:hypothetical protein